MIFKPPKRCVKWAYCIAEPGSHFIISVS